MNSASSRVFWTIACTSSWFAFVLFFFFFLSVLCHMLFPTILVRESNPTNIVAFNSVKKEGWGEGGSVVLSQLVSQSEADKALRWLLYQWLCNSHAVVSYVLELVVCTACVASLIVSGWWQIGTKTAPKLPKVFYKIKFKYKHKYRKKQGPFQSCSRYLQNHIVCS